MFQQTGSQILLARAVRVLDDPQEVYGRRYRSSRRNIGIFGQGRTPGAVRELRVTAPRLGRETRLAEDALGPLPHHSLQRPPIAAEELPEGGAVLGGRRPGGAGAGLGSVAHA